MNTRASDGVGIMRRRIGAILGAALLCLLLCAAAAPTARAAEFGISSFTAGPEANAYTPDPTLAGAHPDLVTSFDFIRKRTPNPSYNPAICAIFPTPTFCNEFIEEVIENPRTLRVDIPAGVALNPQVASTCQPEQYQSSSCPPSSQVGDGELRVALQSAALQMKLYNMPPRPDEAAHIGLIVQGVAIGEFSATVTPEGNYQIRTVSENVYPVFGHLGYTIRLWGVPGAELTPGDPSDDRAFVTSPTRCGEPAVTTLSVDTYENPGKFYTAQATAPPATGCASLPYDPAIVVRTGARVAGGPAALKVDLLFPQTTDPNVRGTAHLKKATVLLPEGVSINPGVARDLSACSDAAFAKHSAAPANCPAGSKIGVIGIDTPLLADPIPGDIYMGEPKPGNRFRIFLYAARPGVRIKLEGSVRPDPETGQLLAVFDDNPQLPFTRFHLRFRGGTRSALAMPVTCGPKTTVATFEPWSGQPPAAVASRFQIYATEDGEPCPETQPFKPNFVAGTTIPWAGGDTGFSVSFGRSSDQDQWLGSLKVDLPAGLLGRLAAIPMCSLAQSAANECSEASLVGGTAVSAGVGEAMLVLPGKVYLTEPPKPGQIAGLAIVVRAVAGPYDLGTVVVRAGIKVNPDTSLTVVSDPLPTILEGIPLRIRRVTVNVDRPGFMFNPTDCSPKKITGEITSASGTKVGVASPFGVRNCGELPFDPAMSIGTSKPDDEARVGLRVRLTAQPGHANIRQVQVVLPPKMGARLDGPIQTQCTEEQFAADRCPEASRIGHASATTPVLPTPLTGDVFFLENVGADSNALPKLAIRLKGMITLDLIGDVTLTEGGRVTNTFTAVPDAPISEFELVLEGGDKAVLTAADICAGDNHALVSTIAHSGKTDRERVRVEVAGCASGGEESESAEGRSRIHDSRAPGEARD